MKTTMTYDEAVKLPANDHAVMGDCTPYQYAQILMGRIPDATPAQIEAAAVIVMHDFADGTLQEWLDLHR